MTAPKILDTDQPTSTTDDYFDRATGVESQIPAPVLTLLRNLQTKITAAEARIEALENA